ncbi:DEAD/DEAH box helicase family protein, partial [Candidatus Dojkabacteria bacterium]|nr:DEAD/DEAH box helicase family protein [Candidatus Dojkabacteria bacterium]
IFSNKKLDISQQTLLQNLREVQKEQGIPASKELEGLNFTIEMETGTGKTYSYTKTMYELNERYGWSKFIIMVPSVAIREGVHKSLQITADHFQETYGKKIRFFIYDTKNKSNLVNIKNFANTANIEVIIMNYQAFASRSKDARKIFQKLDNLQSEKPIDIIKRSRPILIIDEPQKFGPTAEDTIKEFNPLFILRYSATHKEDYNKVYRLDAIDAFNQKLVKKINVKGIEVIGGGGTNSYLFVDRIIVKKDAYPSVVVEMEVKQKNGIKKVLKKLDIGDNLYELSGELEQYKSFVVKEIDGRTDGVTFTNGIEVDVGQTIGDVNESHIRRIQIRETIQSHLQKERLLFKQGIKVLSLFFIDEVAKYRQYEGKNEIPGEYAQIFEEEYERAIAQNDLFDTDYNEYLSKHPAKKVHDGYFSIDKKGKFTDSKVKRGEESSDDISAYDLIMKNKERLLSFSEPTRFIFSHSALREGWDNPNVFQICTLKQSSSDISRRQEIGRGLRICVNQNGERMDYDTLENEFFDYNTLTIVASESYDTFAKSLQKEIVESLSNRPTELTADVFQDRVLVNSDGEKFVFDNVSATKLVISLSSKGYLDEDFKVTQELIDVLDQDKLELPENLVSFKDQVANIIRQVHGTATFKATSNEKIEDVYEPTLEPNDNFSKKEFQQLWNKIKAKTTYEVDFNSDELIENSIKAINATLDVTKVQVKIEEGDQGEKIKRELENKVTGLEKTKSQMIKTASIIGNLQYDVINEITKGARITRKTTGKILAGINKEKFHLFTENPEDFISKVIRIITEQKATTLINSVRYSKINQSYDDDIFTINNFRGSLRENILKVKKHIYDYVKTDSLTERHFAEDL